MNQITICDVNEKQEPVSSQPVSDPLISPQKIACIRNKEEEMKRQRKEVHSEQTFKGLSRNQKEKSSSLLIPQQKFLPDPFVTTDLDSIPILL